MFQYRIKSINEDCKTAEFEYESKFITKGGHEFPSYPNTTGNNSVIKVYKLSTLKDDHEIFNQHLGRGNRLANDEKEAKEKETEKNKAKVSDDVSDLDEKFMNGIKGFKLLLGEFECVGDLKNFNEYGISRGVWVCKYCL